MSSQSIPLFTSVSKSNFIVSVISEILPVSTYISFCTIRLTSGNYAADIRAVSCSPLSDWFPLDFTPYINISMSWSLSLQVSFCCKAHFAICTSESINVLLVVEQCCTSFWHLHETNFVSWPADYNFNQFVCIILSFYYDVIQASTRSSWLRCIKSKMTCCACWVAILN